MINSLSIIVFYFIFYKKVKNSSLLSKFLNDKKSRIRCKSGNSLHSNTPEFARLILFDFLSKISIRNSLIFLLLDLKLNFATIFFIFYNLCILSYSSEVSKTNLFRSNRAIKLGITISPLNKSASSQTKSTF